MSNEQQNKEQPQDNAQQTVQDNVQPQSTEQTEDDSGFFSTPLGKILAGIVIVIVVVGFAVLKLGARSHNISKHTRGAFGANQEQAIDAKKKHGSNSSLFNRLCKQSTANPMLTQKTGIIRAELSEDNKDLVLYYSVKKQEVADKLASDASAVEASKADRCKEPNFTRILNAVDSLEIVYLRNNEKIASTKVPEC